MEFNKASIWLAGLIGALISSWWHKDDLTDKKAWLIFVTSGACSALYLTGMVSSYFSITDPNNVAGVGFLLGTFGGSLMAAINRAIKSADLWALIRSKFGGGTP